MSTFFETGNTILLFSWLSKVLLLQNTYLLMQSLDKLKYFETSSLLWANSFQIVLSFYTFLKLQQSKGLCIDKSSSKSPSINFFAEFRYFTLTTFCIFKKKCFSSKSSKRIFFSWFLLILLKIDILFLLFKSRNCKHC